MSINTGAPALDTSTPEDALEIGGSVDLGHDTDCETCGSSYNSVEWYYDADGQIDLRSSFGCYGGDSKSTTDVDEAVEFILDLRASFPDAAAGLDAEAARLRDQVTAART